MSLVDDLERIRDEIQTVIEQIATTNPTPQPFTSTAKANEPSEGENINGEQQKPPR